VKVGRNDACPCGSGRKVKRCCGVDGIRARMRRTDDAVEELFGLASLFPRYRPASPSFDDWALTAPDELSREALGEGVAHLDAEEHDETSLEILEHDPEARADQVEALALTLDCHDLWSVIESGRAAEAVDKAPGRRKDRVLAAEAERLTTDWHRDRLRVLVRRLREQLPEPAYPRASAALAQACDRLESDEALARRLRVELLFDSLPRVYLATAAAA
jgi:SEC-C motif-containing protein